MSFNINDSLIDTEYTPANLQQPTVNLQSPAANLQPQQLCPVVAARKQIKGSSWYVKPANTISGAAQGIECEMSYGDMCFYMTARNMDVARFELVKPNLEQCLQYLQRMDFAGKDYQYLYKRIIQQIPSKMTLYYSFTKTYDLLAKLEEYLTLRLAMRKDVKLNISIPHLQLDKHTAQMIVFAPKVLADAVDALCKFANSINIKSIVTTKYNLIVNEAKPPKELDLTTKMPKMVDDALDVPTCMKKIKELLEHEIRVAKYIYDIEEFQAKEIEILNQLSSLAKSMLSDLQ
jgi:hypothetical protein